MAINRFTQLTPSAYKPLSMQEILMTPLAMRQKHDDLLSKQELIKSGLAKTDPYDNHFEEAVTLKKDIESKLDETAKKISEQGFDNNLLAETISLNRQYNDLISPTGKLGQINQHKIDLQNTYKNYIDDAIKMGNSQDVAEIWAKEALQKHITEPGWDDKGRINKFKIDKTPVKYQDVRAIVNDLATKAGFNESTKSFAFDNIVTDPNTGMTYVKGGQNKHGNGNNYQQLKALSDYINNEVLRENSDIRKSLDYTRQDIRSVLDSVSKQSKIYKNSKNIDEISSSISNLHMPDKDGSNSDSDIIPTGITDPTSTRTIGGENKVDFDLIGKIPSKTPLAPPRNLNLLTSEQQQKYYNDAKKTNSKITYKDVIKDPLIKRMYENSYNKLIKEGKINKNRSINDPLVAKSIENYMNNVMPPVTLSNKIIRASIEPSNDMFMGAMSKKDATSRNETIRIDLENGLRTIIDPETNKPLTYLQFKEKANEKGWKVEYIGYDSPLNFKGYNFKDPKQQVMAHKVNIKDKDNNIVGTTAVSRSHEEKNTPEFKAASLLTFSYRNAVLNSGEWTPIGTDNSPAKNLKGSKVKYNYDGSIDIKTTDGKIYENLPTQELSKYIFNNYRD